MTKYFVRQFYNAVYSCIIEAESEKEAKEIAQKIDPSELDYDEYADFSECNELNEDDNVRHVPMFKASKDKLGYRKLKQGS